MPLEQAVLDWEVVGHTTGPNGERQIEVVVVAARRDMVSSLLDGDARRWPPRQSGSTCAPSG